MNRSLVAPLAAVLALGTAIAEASPVASSELSNFQFQLIDLDPADGLTPWIDLSAFPNSQVSIVGDASGGDQGTSVFGPVTALVNGQYGLLGAAFIDGDLSSGGSAQSFAMTEAYPGQFPSVTATAMVGSSSPAALFTLSPHTEVRVTGSADATASTARDYGSSEIADGRVEFAFLTALGNFESRDVLDVLSYSVDPSSLNKSGQADLSVSFFNPTDTATQGSFYVKVSTQAAFGPAVIPEPGKAALMLGALGAMVLLGRVRRRAT